MEKTQVAPPLVMIGGSAGSLDAVLQIAQALPLNFSLAVLVVMHRHSQHESLLTELISAKSALTVKEIEDKERAQSGYIYLAPADYHVLCEKDGCFSLDYSEKEHHSRPSIDVSFMSAVAVYGSSLIGVVLSGANADGAEGLSTVKEAGGLTIVQDPIEALVDYMPVQAIRKARPDHIVRAENIADLIKDWEAQWLSSRMAG